MYLLLSVITGVDTDLNINADQEILNKLKADLMAIIDKNAILEEDEAVCKFDALYLMQKSQVPLISDLDEIFDTDLANSIFNQISIEEASSRGEIFFNEYLNFHKLDYKEERPLTPKNTVTPFRYPELDFGV